MKWNQKTIHQWGIDTFGNAALNTLGVAIRMSKETVELSNVLMTMDDVDKISMEAADVAIVLLQVVNCIGFDAQEAEASRQLTKIMTCLSALEDIYEFDLMERIQAKMEINAARQWAQGKDGSFQHV